MKYDAICNENFTEKTIYQIRIDFLCNSLKSKIIPLIDEHEELKTKTIEEKKSHFIKLCELVLVNTSSVLLNFKSFFNKENIESLNNNVRSIMRNGKLFKMAKINERTKNISQNIFNVSLDGENKQQDFFTELSSEAVTPSKKNTANNVCLNPGIRLNKYDAKKCKNRVDVGSKSKKIELSSAATKPKMKDIADYVCCNSEIQLQRYCIKEYNSHVDVAPKSTKCKYNEAIHFNTESRADKISSVNGNASLNPEIRLYKFDMKEYNNHVDDGLKSKKIKLSNEVIAENTTNQIMSFKNRDCWNPEIKLQRCDVNECSRHIDVGPNSKRKKEEKRATRKMSRKTKVNNK